MVTAAPQGQYVANKVQEFREYLAHEIAILEGPCTSYYGIAYTILETTAQRIRLVIETNVPKEIPGNIPQEHRLRIQREWREYLSAVAGVLLERVRKYQPEDGSFWEDARKTFEELASWARAAS